MSLIECDVNCEHVQNDKKKTFIHEYLQKYRNVSIYSIYQMHDWSNTSKVKRSTHTYTSSVKLFGVKIGMVRTNTRYTFRILL